MAVAKGGQSRAEGQFSEGRELLGLGVECPRLYFVVLPEDAGGERRAVSIEELWLEPRGSRCPTRGSPVRSTKNGKTSAFSFR